MSTEQENTDLTSNDAKPKLSDVCLEAIEIANKMEEQIKITLPSDCDYDTILRVGKYTAYAIREQIPMYQGGLNPKWALYDLVFDVFNGRLNGR